MPTFDLTEGGISHLSFRGGAAAVRGRASQFGLHDVLPQTVFSGALRRERRRASRFEETFAVVVASVEGLPGRNHHTTAAVVAALDAVAYGNAVIGWLKKDRLLGVIVPGAARPARCEELSSRVRRELAARLSPLDLAQVVTRVCIESGYDPKPSPMRVSTDADGWTTGQKARALVSAAAKRALDVLGSAALLLITAPLLLVVAALVKLTSSGPVLFRQQRIGWTGQPFTMLKFRTMRVDADSSIHQQYITQFIGTNGAAKGSGADAPFKITNDPRVTPLGSFLRKTSLDELPQFWNVLRGEMSLVGPRPPLPYEVRQYRRWHHQRVLEAKPGITGLWQVVGRSRTTFDDMVRLDVRYARTRSLWTDIKILLATPRAVISGKGAC